jgi:hypothetical protein
VATNVLEENILMIDRIRNKGYFDCAVPIHTDPATPSYLSSSS